jgi:predicted Zn finger-like uncharacterized protein
MITYCPACRTHFRVRVEQLAARAGQVRCGKCGQAFNALDHLIEENAPAQELGAIPTETAAAGSAPEPAEVALDIPLEAASPAMFETEPVSAGSAYDFGPAAAAGPGQPRRRWPWLAGAFLLLALLLVQAAYQYRGAIVLLVPETKPYAAALCATLGCELPLPRRVELMSIEASDLQADTTNPNVMVLSATLKNRAVFNQQHPLLELTLTDAQDQPVVRRVLAPQEYVGKAANAQIGFAANSEISIKVFIESSQVKATGYRLYLFYP